MSSFCSQEVAAFFMLMSVANHLPDRCFLGAWLIVIEITGSKIRTDVRVVYNLPAIAL